MAGITVQSGNHSLGHPTGETVSSQPLNILILGDFSGRESHGLIQPATLSERKIHRVDKDSFDEVFARLNVSLKLPITEQPIAFRELDQLHPDHLYEHVELFARYRQLMRQLSSSAGFQVAVDALTDEGILQPPTDSEQTAERSPDLLSDVLAGSRAGQQAPFDVAALIRQTVAPYVEPKRHPKAEEYKAALEQALSDVMRKIMHISHFKNLEASWRSVDLLNRRLDTDKNVHLHILDVCRQELLQDGEGDSPEQTQLGKRLLDQVSVPGAAKIDCLLLDADIGVDAEDAHLVTYLGKLADRLGARLLLGANAQLIGYDSFYGLAVEHERASNSPMQDAWRALQKQEYLGKVYVAAPGFMVRLPYGRRTSVIDAFAFDELPQSAQHSSYLWGNSAYLLVLSLIQAIERTQPSGKFDSTRTCIERMPLHAYKDEDGEECVKPCAEAYLTATQVAELEQTGLTVLQSVKNSDSILIERWVPLARPYAKC